MRGDAADAPSAMDRLLGRSLGPMSQAPVDLGFLAESIRLELAGAFRRWNGWSSFDGALIVRPEPTDGRLLGLRAWNDQSVWRECYPEGAGYLFFAEDVFGHPFGINEQGVVTLDLETGETERVGRNLEEWAEVILADSNYWTGWTLAHDWQEKEGVLPHGYRLVPRRPFVLGGEYSLDNLVLARDTTALRARGELAKQLREAVPGQEVHYELPIKQVGRQ